MKNPCKVTLNFLILLWITTLHAEVRIEITQGVDSARPIAVLPFKWAGSGTAPEDIGSIVIADLRNSGKFNPLDSSRIPQKSVFSASEVTPTVWTAIGIASVVVGQLHPDADGSYMLSYQLVDTSSNPGSVLIQNQFKVNKQWLRYAAHTASNEVFQQLIGIKGAFRTRIAYIVQTNSEQFPYELRVSDYDGYNQFIVHRSPEPLMSPAWTPDGSKLAYVTFENGHSELVIQTLTNGIIYQVASFPRHNGAPAFSPDGSKLAFSLSKSGSLNLYVMDIISGEIQQITDDRSNNTEPTWFPDSQTLAYTSDQAGRPQVYKIDVNGGAPQRLTWEGTQNQNSDVSSDGKMLVMVNTAGTAQNIATQNLATGNVQIITGTYLDETPSLSPNGTMVIYSSKQGLRSVLQLVSTDGRFKRNFPDINGQVKFPAWSPYL